MRKPRPLTRSPRPAQAGFSLIEIILVVVLIHDLARHFCDVIRPQSVFLRFPPDL